MSTSQKILNKIADSYYAALIGETAIEPIATFNPGIMMAEGYRVQADIVARFEAQGRRVVGYKCAAVSATAQTKMGITEPIYGCLFDSHAAAPGVTLDSASFIQPFIEGELAFIIGQTLTGPGVTAEDILAVTDYVVPAFDIVDFRATGWQVGLGEALCTNVYARHFMLADRPIPADRLDLPNVGITLAKNGEPVATATAAAIMGHPARAIAWLVNKLAEHGRRLEAGQFALTGAITRPQPIVPGDEFEGTFKGLGGISVQFE